MYSSFHLKSVQFLEKNGLITPFLLPHSFTPVFLATEILLVSFKVYMFMLISLMTYWHGHIFLAFISYNFLKLFRLLAPSWNSFLLVSMIPFISVFPAIFLEILNVNFLGFHCQHSFMLLCDLIHYQLHNVNIKETLVPVSNFIMDFGQTYIITIKNHPYIKLKGISPLNPTGSSSHRLNLG